MSIPTPHIEAKKGDIAKCVLMPGDPLRAKFIAENFLQDVKCFNTVRNMLGYTGTYKGEKVSVMGSGMGIPSISIYSYELYNFYDVDTIIRVGSAGSLRDDVHIKDIVLAQGASTNSSYQDNFNIQGHFAPIADFELLMTAYNEAKNIGKNVSVGNVLSSDVFYNDNNNINDVWKKMGIIAVEMESAALYMNAARANKRALCILTVSDHIYLDENLSSLERQEGFKEMMQIALETAIKSCK